jgi:hypothetical protein
MTQTIISKLSEMIPSFEASPFCSTSSSSRSITSFLSAQKKRVKKPQATNRLSVGVFSFLLNIFFDFVSFRREIWKGLLSTDLRVKSMYHVTLLRLLKENSSEKVQTNLLDSYKLKENLSEMIEIPQFVGIQSLSSSPSFHGNATHSLSHLL